MPEICVRVTQEDDCFVALCLDYDVVSQGPTEESALDNINEAVAGFLVVASHEEIQRRMDEQGRIHIVSLGDGEAEVAVRSECG